MAYTTITDPSAHFQTALYTGNGGTQSITNDGNSNLKPDFMWIKDRSASNDHKLQDSTRGSTYTIESNTNTAQYNDTTAITSFNTDGFTTGNNGNTNTNSNNYAGWQWKANGGTTASNNSGTITSTVQANTTAGFSIVTYAGSGSNATIGHGLGVAPEIVLVKKYSSSGSARDWIMYGKALGNTKALMLNNTDSLYTLTDAWNSTTPTSTTFAIGTNGRVNDSGASYVAYCFAGKQGYSKFGSYSGNQSTNGPFLYFGFKPAFLIVKKTSSAESWFLIDSKRFPLNTGNIPRLIPDSSDAESTDASIAGDFLSNGFKIRATQNMINESGTYFYMAFAKNPFVATNGVPATAR